mmetsp:Transcript_3652/g.4043  ORF Transcript_3652/g.4043 Transcript_3652/m.4043 type:complete len:676 (+) Transcript_3652:89-2116(+)
MSSEDSSNNETSNEDVASESVESPKTKTSSGKPPKARSTPDVQKRSQKSRDKLGDTPGDTKRKASRSKPELKRSSSPDRQGAIKKKKRHKTSSKHPSPKVQRTKGTTDLKATTSSGKHSKKANKKRTASVSMETSATKERTDSSPRTKSDENNEEVSGDKASEASESTDNNNNELNKKKKLATSTASTKRSKLTNAGDFSSSEGTPSKSRTSTVEEVDPMASIPTTPVLDKQRKPKPAKAPVKTAQMRKSDSSSVMVSKNKPELSTGKKNHRSAEEKGKHAKGGGGIFGKFFNKKKKKDEGGKARRNTHSRSRQVITADCFSDLPSDLQKKITKAKLDIQQVNDNFKYLLNILHFLTKDVYRTTDHVPEERRSRQPYASTQMMQAAKASLKRPERDIKKHYRNIEFSGKGGFGKVFVAKNCATKQRVAIKRLPHITEKDRRNNYCEISFLSSAKHDNVVKYHESWIVKEETWIVTEFLEGGTLNEAVKVHQFSERHIAYVSREILKALKHLHRMNYAHRDLKSGNIMMSIDGRIKLIDFGLCADVTKGARTQMLGSPYWMPPEMIMRVGHDVKADIWSFAICVLEMYLKEPPYASSRLRAMFLGSVGRTKEAIPPRASKLANNFLKKCLLVDPNKRATANELYKHEFVNQSGLSQGIKDVLRGVFVSNSLALSGI